MLLHPSHLIRTIVYARSGATFISWKGTSELFRELRWHVQGYPAESRAAGPKTSGSAMSISYEMVGLRWLTQASLVAQMIKNLPAVWETQVQSLCWENPLGKGMATHTSILAWTVPWTEEPGRLQSMGLQKVGLDWNDWQPTVGIYACKLISLKLLIFGVIHTPWVKHSGVSGLREGTAKIMVNKLESVRETPILSAVAFYSPQV